MKEKFHLEWEKYYIRIPMGSVVPRSRFLAFRFWGNHQIHLNLPVKLNTVFRFLFKFELDVDSFGSRRDADYSEVVSTLL